LRGLRLPLLGEHQRLNAAVAAWTVRALAKQIPVDDETVRAGLMQVQWPGRLQLVERPSGQKIVLDGAHNIGSAEALRAAIAKNFGEQSPVLILGILKDKDWQPMCRVLAPLASKILVVPVGSTRSAEAQELAPVCRAANPTAEVVECASLADALKRAHNDEFVVVTGSLYLIGEAMELLKLSAGGPTGERDLNEWQSGVTSSHEAIIASPRR
jgi:dihydrofolate synthase/folylpolyglutamate synthase